MPCYRALHAHYIYIRHGLASHGIAAPHVVFSTCWFAVRPAMVPTDLSSCRLWIPRSEIATRLCRSETVIKPALDFRISELSDIATGRRFLIEQFTLDVPRSSDSEHNLLRAALPPYQSSRPLMVTCSELPATWRSRKFYRGEMKC